jgi:rhamnopyranosyl-N-acetylglucosaminyl-diphospho-decaprenol beta-1,3/1,4-galactofuranosyltransferase
MADGLAQTGGDRAQPSSTSDQDRLRVAAVIVTYNRRELLMESLAAVLGQSRAPGTVIVIDNASTDGTAAAARTRYPAAEVVELPGNTGGAGGFAYGLALALAEGADLAWLMDDDTIPEPDALAELLAARARHPGRSPALVASRVVWTDGRPHPMNTPRAKPLSTRAERAAAAAAGCMPIRSASFVSVLLDGAVCRERGLPLADYFLWNDDFEFTTRILRGNAGLLCPASVVTHKTANPGSSDTNPGERFFFEVRNKVWTLRSRVPLAPHERTLYLAATLRRWARTFVRSTGRRQLGSSLISGLVAGLRTRPRQTSEVFASLGLGLPVAGAQRDVPGRAAR